MEFRTIYSKKVRVEQGPGSEPSQTKQSFAKECDVNEILRRYEKSGLPPELKQGGVYGDFVDVPSYQEALEIIIKAETLFNELPVRVRDEFGHDPSKFLDFAHNPASKERMIELGLAVDTRKGQPPTGGVPKSPAATGGATDGVGQPPAVQAPVAGA